MILVCYLGLHVQLSQKTPRSLNSSATSLSSLDASSAQVVSAQSPPSPRGIKPFGKMRCQCSTAFWHLFIVNINNNWRALGKNVLTDIFGFFKFVLKSGWLFACDPTLLHIFIFVNKKQTKKYYRVRTFLIMLGHMQKVSLFWAQMKKNAKCQ